MMMKKTFNIIILFLLAMTVSAEKLPYKDSSMTPQERAKDLLGRMTLDEKIMQLQCVWGDNKKVVFPDGKFDAKLAKEYFPNGLGEMVRPNEYLGPDIKQNHQAYPALQGAEQYNAIQKYFVEQTRLGIPVVMHDEGVHGVWTQEATNQPVPIALASTWDLNLISKFMRLPLWRCVVVEPISRLGLYSIWCVNLAGAELKRHGAKIPT